MAKNVEYQEGTIEFHRHHMKKGISYSVIGLLGTMFVAWLTPESPFGYVTASVMIAGIFAFFSHRKALKLLKAN